MKIYSFVLAAAVLVLAGCGGTTPSDRTSSTTPTGERKEMVKQVTQKDSDLTAPIVSDDTESELEGLALFDENLESELAELEAFEF